MKGKFLFVIALGLMIILPGMLELENGVARAKNLVPNAQFEKLKDSKIPAGWQHGHCNISGVIKSRFDVGKPIDKSEQMLGISGGQDRASYWECTLEGIKPYTDYIVSFTVYRDWAMNGMHPRVLVFGQEYILNQVWFTDRIHRVSLVVNSNTHCGQAKLSLKNPHPVWIWFGNPVVTEETASKDYRAYLDPGLRKINTGILECWNTGMLGKNKDYRIKVVEVKSEGGDHRPDIRDKDGRTGFPLGLYGTKVKDYPDIAKTSFNLVKAPPEPEAVKKAHGLGLNVFCHMPGNNEEIGNIAHEFKRAKVQFSPNDFFYIADEPELRSVSALKLEKKRQILKETWPQLNGMMAINRPRFVKRYQEAAEIFLMDQYPVPNMPMTWLSDSLDEGYNIRIRRIPGLKKCRKEEEMNSRGKKFSRGKEDPEKKMSVKRGRKGPTLNGASQRPESEIWAVIQAFGGPERAKHGWPRLPTYKEIRCLSYLAIVHGATGLMYYTYPSVHKNKEAWQGLNRIVSQIDSLDNWLTGQRQYIFPKIEMLCPYKADASGRKALHCAWLSNNGKCLLIAVNVIDEPVQAKIYGVPSCWRYVDEKFAEHRYIAKNGNIVAKFEPYEVKVF